MSRKSQKRGWRERVADILAAIDEISTFVNGMDLSTFAADTKTLKAVLANFTIIGEAARQIPDDLCERRPSIPWRQMRDMRNIIVHVYFAVEPSIVWSTIHNDLPSLKTQLGALLASQEP